jgi:hypothetical protein
VACRLPHLHLPLDAPGEPESPAPPPPGCGDKSDEDFPSDEEISNQAEESFPLAVTRRFGTH